VELNKRYLILTFSYSWFIPLSVSCRYREIPTFGRDTIRKFVRNASAMTKLAARDYEDLLQVRKPVAFSFMNIDHV
jgi:hypothetical protein